MPQSTSWERLAQLPGGTVAAFAVAGQVVFAASPAGVRRSHDAGGTWCIAGGESAVPFATAVCAAPRFGENQTVYVASRQGAYRSTDAGETWQQVLSGSALALGIVTADVVFAGTELDGVLRSEDGGRTWTSANPGLLDLTILALALSPCFADDGIALLATASGIYRTRNGGRSWRAADLGPSDPAVQCLAVSPTFSDDQLVLAGTEAGGLLRSDDAGDTWRQLDVKLPGLLTLGEAIA